MLFGAHVSIAGSITEAPKRAKAIGCEVFQIFTRSPQGGSVPPITDEIAKEFRRVCDDEGYTDYVVHTPYFINFGSTNNRIFYGSASVIRQELERSSMLGVKYIMTHLGSGKDLGEKKAVTQTIKGLKTALKDYKGTTELLIEDSAGAGAIIGDQFEEIAKIMDGVNHKKLTGVCLDTCHAFASGYDLRAKEVVDKTVKQFDKAIGLERLKWIQLNDSKFGFGEHKDRHEHIGKGAIGLEGLRAFVNHPKLKKLGAVVETPWEGQADDIAILKSLRK